MTVGSEVVSFRALYVVLLFTAVMCPGLSQAQAEFMKKGHSGVLGVIGYSGNSDITSRSAGIGLGVRGTVNINLSYADISAGHGGDASAYGVALEILVLKHEERNDILSAGPVGALSEEEPTYGSDIMLSGGFAVYWATKQSEHLLLVPSFCILSNWSAGGNFDSYQSAVISASLLLTGKKGLGILITPSISASGNDSVFGISAGILFRFSDGKRLWDEDQFDDF